MQNCCLSFKIPEKNYKGTNIASIDLGTQCTASCEVNVIYGCENVLRENSAHRWATSIIDNYQWIQLNFTYAHQVRRIDILHSCVNKTQCTQLDLHFGDGTMIRVRQSIELRLAASGFVFLLCVFVVFVSFYYFIPRMAERSGRMAVIVVYTFSAITPV